MRMIPLALVALLGLAPLAQAQQQPYGPNPDSKSLRQHYVEGRLDIARVIYKTDLWSACGIVPARLVYEDSQGERHTVEYKAWGSGCSGN